MKDLQKKLQKLTKHSNEDNIMASNDINLPTPEEKIYKLLPVLPTTEFNNIPPSERLIKYISRKKDVDSKYISIPDWITNDFLTTEVLQKLKPLIIIWLQEHENVYLKAKLDTVEYLNKEDFNYFDELLLYITNTSTDRLNKDNIKDWFTSSELRAKLKAKYVKSELSEDQIENALLKVLKTLQSLASPKVHLQNHVVEKLLPYIEDCTESPIRNKIIARLTNTSKREDLLLDFI